MWNARHDLFLLSFDLPWIWKEQKSLVYSLMKMGNSLHGKPDYEENRIEWPLPRC